MDDRLLSTLTVVAPVAVASGCSFELPSPTVSDRIAVPSEWQVIRGASRNWILSATKPQRDRLHCGHDWKAAGELPKRHLAG